MRLKDLKPLYSLHLTNCFSFIYPLLFCALILAPAHTTAAEINLNNTKAQIYFSPQEGATEAIVKVLSKAKTEILVQAYSFTSKDIAKALTDAYKRKVHIEIVLDKSNKTGKYSAATFTRHAGIPTYIDSKHAIAHNKVMIIDNEIVVTGSFNFTKAAEEKNAENLLVIYSKELARIYRKNWDYHKDHSTSYNER